MVEPLHDSRTCPMCLRAIHGRNPRPKPHPPLEPGGTVLNGGTVRVAENGKPEWIIGGAR